MPRIARTLQLPSDKKLTQAELDRVYCTLARYTPGGQVYIRGLHIRCHEMERQSLQVSPIGHPTYTTYFWWNFRGYYKTLPVPALEHKAYWNQILTLLNEDPGIILERHRTLRKHCLYIHRPRPTSGKT